MNDADYAEWYETSVREYAAEKTKAGNLPEESALRVSKEEFDFLIPKGRSTPNQHIFSIRDMESGQNVGMIWYNSLRPNEPDTVFIFDIRVKEAERGKGYGKASLLFLEEKTRELGKEKISLHVFAHNKTAIQLYKSLGYLTTNLLMSKELA